MKYTRRVLFAQNTELNARLAACGPDMTLSRKQLHERLKSAQSEIDALTARVSALTAQHEAAASELAKLKADIADAQKAKKEPQPA